MRYFFIFTSLLVLFIACKKSTDPLDVNPDDQPIQAQLIETRDLPFKTLTVLDFDRAILYEGKKLIIADITDTNNISVFSEYELEPDEYYNTIQLDRFIIVDDESNDNRKKIIDIETGNIQTIEDSLFIHQVSISPVDHTILYTAAYHDSSVGNVAKMRYIDSSQNVSTLADCTFAPQWSNHKNWFTFQKVLFEQGRFLYWEQVLYNISGEKIILTRDPYAFGRPIWTNDGSAFVNYFVQNSGIMCVEFDWQNDKPRIIKKTTGYLLGDPILWSFDGQFIVHVKHYEDPHIFDILGSQVMVSDRDLNLNFTVCDNDTVLEMPLKWNNNNTLITYEADWYWGYNHYFPLKLKKYKIGNN